MSAQPTTIEKLRGLRWAISMNVANQFFVHFTYFGSAFILFLDQLGLSKSGIGFVLSLVPFANAMALVVAPFAARFGHKRTFVLFFFLRKTATIPLLLTPWIVTRYGTTVAFFFVATVVGIFALVRSVEETAYNPWYQEFVPRSMLGKYAAINNIFTAIAAMIAVSIASYVVGTYKGLSGFMGLMAAGIVAGYLSAWLATFIPGGAPTTAPAERPTTQRNMWATLQDRDFLFYLFGLTLVTLGTAPVASFLPLYLQEQAKLPSSIAILVQLGTMAGSIVSGYLWGWAADRYGSRPVTLTSVFLLLLMPILWWLIPAQAPLNTILALLFAFGQGVANLGWGIGAGRLLFASIVPTERNADYLAVWFAWAGIAAGISQLVGGRFLDLTRDFSASFGGLTLNNYGLLFVLSTLMLGMTSLLIKGIRSDSKVSFGEFAGLFVHGNPVTAISSLIRFHRATIEQDTILQTEQLGKAKSLLTSDELLEALSDPRFNVRFEAIITIARMPSDPSLVNALVAILKDDTPALSAIAAWALGRMGDRHALEPLRQGLNARYRSIQAHCARSLANLGDKDAAPILLERLAGEPDEGLQLAFVSALGKLTVMQATGPLLTLLRSAEQESVRMELTLALARILNSEAHFVQLWRATRREPGLALAQDLSNLQKLFEKKPNLSPAIHTFFAQSIEAFSHEEVAQGALSLSSLLADLSLTECGPAIRQIRRECLAQLSQPDCVRFEYILLTSQLLRNASIMTD
ncbi:MAG: MFS transporter [Caldilineaceae bacterium]